MPLTDVPTPFRSAPQGDLAASPAALLYPDFVAEHEATGRMLARIPGEQLGWRPHQRSRTLGELATHVADIPNRGVAILTTDEMDIVLRSPLAPLASVAELLRLHHGSTGRLQDELAAMDPDRLSRAWTLRRGSQVLASAPRQVLLRTMVMSHLVHHRAQIGLYLRLLDIPVPGMYGPSADDLPVRSVA